MLVANIADQLGNQMFAYASVKTIAQKKGYDFRFIRAKNSLINDNDAKYGNEIHTIFPNTSCEFLPNLPESIIYTYRESIAPTDKKAYSDTAWEVSDNTYMHGHFISFQYFHDNLAQVRHWFTFSEDVLQNCQNKLDAIQKKYPQKHLVAIHFRVGDDYLKQGFLLHPTYWTNAAEYILKKYGQDNVIFLPFYDCSIKSSRIVRTFFDQYPCENIRGSLVEDMCCLTLVKNLIVCNSSFSAMAGILNSHHDKLVLRPSVYPAGTHYQPDDCFPNDWVVIPAKRNLCSTNYYRYMCFKGWILKLIR